MILKFKWNFRASFFKRKTLKKKFSNKNFNLNYLMYVYLWIFLFMCLCLYTHKKTSFHKIYVITWKLVCTLLNLYFILPQFRLSLYLFWLLLRDLFLCRCLYMVHGDCLLFEVYKFVSICAKHEGYIVISHRPLKDHSFSEIFTKEN